MLETVAVVGGGGAGIRHIAALRRCRPNMRIVAVSRTAGVVSGADVVVSSVKGALDEGVAAAVLAGPATHRLDQATEFAAAGVHLFLEKPIATTLDGLDDLMSVLTARSLTAGVGYNLRFSGVLVAAKYLVDVGTIGALRWARAEVGQYLPDWRPGEDYHSLVSARRVLGGGALLELSHEFDYMNWFLGPPESAFGRCTQVGDLGIDVEDSVDALVRYPPNVEASIHLDFLQRPSVRRARFVGAEGAIDVDLLTGDIVTRHATREPSVSRHPSPTVAETYDLQAADFIAAVETSSQPRVTVPSGVAALEVVSAVRRASELGRDVSVHEVRCASARTMT
jgi:predicted dehydrogenase